MFEKLSSLMSNARADGKIALSEREMRILESKLNFCSVNISRALFEMIRLNVDVLPSTIRTCPIKSVPEFLGADQKLVVLYNQIIGTSGSSMLISAHLDNIIKIAEIFLHKEHGYFKELNSENLSVIKEISTILAGYYTTALNELTNSDYALHKPSISIGSYGLDEKILDNLGIGHEKIGTDVLMYENDFYIESCDIRLKAMLFLTPEGIAQIAPKMMVK